MTLRKAESLVLVLGERSDSGTWSHDCVDAPAIGHAFEFVLADRFEVESAAGDEVFDGLGDDDVARTSGREEPRGDGDRKSAWLSVDDLAFADVDCGARLQAELGDAVGDVCPSAIASSKSSGRCPHG